MELKDLKAGQGKVDIEVIVDTKAEVRTFNKYGKDLRVCNATVKDEAGGSIVLSLWNDDIEKINVGDKIKISSGYVSEFNGQKQLSAGKFGKMEVISGTGAKTHEPKAEKKVDKKPVIDSEEIEEVEF
ncbi:MAG: SOSS complex subunit B family protein [Nanoarchaeota archaeon]